MAQVRETLPVGGAGIGGGDNGCASSIRIGGSAEVLARGAGAASGIGGGHDGAVGVWESGSTGDVLKTVGTITIYGDAKVTAFGSSPTAVPPAVRGGAGIGAGRTANWNLLNNPCGVISIRGNANITAYAGRGAEAIGVGSNYNYAGGFDCELQIDDTVSLQAFNKDTVQRAYTPNVTGAGAALLINFTLDDPNSGLSVFPASGGSDNTTSGDSFTWGYSGTSNTYELEIYDNGTLLGTLDSEQVAFGNWAVFCGSGNTALYGNI